LHLDSGNGQTIYLNGYNSGFANAGGGVLSYGTLTVTGAITSTVDATINSVRVGLGAGSVSTNTVVGASTPLNANSTGNLIVAIGYNALINNTTGYQNTGVGSQALYTNTTGYQNVAMGRDTMYRNTTGIENTGIGTEALFENTTGSQNTGLGKFAGPTTGALTNTTCIGANARASASNSVILGNGANVGIGVTAPDSSLNINGTTSTNGVIQVVSNASGKNIDGAAFRAYSDTNYIIGFNNTANSLRGVILGVNSGSVAYQTSSDRRLKTNIEDMPSAIERIKKLRPRKFTWTESGDKEEGFIAQEVHKVFPQFMSGFAGYCDYCQCSYNDLFDGKLCDCCDLENPMRKDGTPYIYGIDYGKFTPYLTKALQETLEIIETQSDRITALETENTTLEQSLATATENISLLKTQMASLEQRLTAAGF
jgi:hypothetical protein